MNNRSKLNIAGLARHMETISNLEQQAILGGLTLSDGNEIFSFYDLDQYIKAYGTGTVNEKYFYYDKFNEFSVVDWDKNRNAPVGYKSLDYLERLNVRNGEDPPREIMRTDGTYPGMLSVTIYGYKDRDSSGLRDSPYTINWAQQIINAHSGNGGGADTGGVAGGGPSGTSSNPNPGNPSTPTVPNLKDGDNFEYGIDPQGNRYRRQIGSDTWEAYNQLEVTINGQSKILYHNPFGLLVSNQGFSNNTGASGGGSGGTSVSNSFHKLLTATGMTASAFGGVMGDLHDLAKIGNFADEAKVLLKNMSKYSGAIGTAIDIVLSAVEMLKDGNLTVDETAAFIANQLIGGTIGAIPFAGGVLSTIYDLSGGDDYLADQIKELIKKYYK